MVLCRQKSRFMRQNMSYLCKYVCARVSKSLTMTVFEKYGKMVYSSDWVLMFNVLMCFQISAKPNNKMNDHVARLKVVQEVSSRNSSASWNSSCTFSTEQSFQVSLMLI